MLVFVGSLAIALIATNVLRWKGNLSWTFGIGGGIFIGLIAGVFVWMVTSFFGNLHPFILLILDGLFVIIIFWAFIAVRFYRDPERAVPAQKGIFVAPADGKIKYIKKIKKNEIPLAVKGNRTIAVDEITKTSSISEDGFQIGIVMSILDVHINRSPIAGKIVFQQHTPGLFLSLKNLEAIIENERNTFVVDSGEFRVGIVQIASRLVRKIDRYKQEGDLVKIGERIGMIKFGSQTDLIIPQNVRVTVREGEQVYAGETVVAELVNNASGDEDSVYYI